MHCHTRCEMVWGFMLFWGVSSCPRGAGVADTPAGRYGQPPKVHAWRRPPALSSAGDTPTDRRDTQSNLSLYTNAPKTHTNNKQQGGISPHVFYCEYFYRLLYVHQWFVGAFFSLRVYHHVLQGRHHEAHTL